MLVDVDAGVGSAMRVEVSARDAELAEIRDSVVKNLGRRLAVEAEWLRLQSDEHLELMGKRLGAEIAVLRGLSRASRQVAHRNVDGMRERAREELERLLVLVRDGAVVNSELRLPAGIADAHLVATSDELFEQMHAAVDSLPLMPPGTFGSLTHESEAGRRLDEETRREAIVAIEVEIERREVERAQKALTSRKKTLKERMGVRDA